MKKVFVLLISVICISNTIAQQQKALSNSEKIYGLSKFWQEVNYNFVYLDKIGKEKWDSIYKQFIPIVLETKNDNEYFKELQRFCALLKDGHTNIYMPPQNESNRMVTMFGEYRLFVYNLNNKAIIFRTNQSKKNEIPVGSEIVEVNGMSTWDYINKNIAPYYAASTEHILNDWCINNLLAGFKGDIFDVKIKKPNAEIVKLRLIHAMTEEKEVYPEFSNNNGLFTFKWLKNDIAYIALNSFSDERIDSLFYNALPEIRKAKGLIVDLRSNGGGNTGIGTEILKYIIPDSILHGAKSLTREHISAYKAWGAGIEAKDTITGKHEWGIDKDRAKKYYLSYNDCNYYHFEHRADTLQVKGKRVVIPTTILIGHQTASAAEDFLIYADGQKHITKIGEPTFGSTGQPYHFELVGGATARICTKKDTYPDGREFVGYGIKPDIEVKLTIEDFIKGKDTVLDYAQNYIEEQIQKKYR